MPIIGHLFHALAKGLEAIGSAAHFLAGILNGFLPVLLAPDQLNASLRAWYRTFYDDDRSAHAIPPTQYDLAPWEAKLFDRYAVWSKRVLVLCSGYGREAIPLAQRGAAVVGVDSNGGAVRTADRLAKQANVRARFHQADILRLPYRPASFDCVLLSSIMYSAIPGTVTRQACLQDLARILTPGGVIILSFEARQSPRSRLAVLRDRICLALARVPGMNAGYQVGDNCQRGHFLHVFQEPEEIRRECRQAGLIMQELDWGRGFAVLVPVQPVAPRTAGPALAAEALRQ